MSQTIPIYSEADVTKFLNRIRASAAQLEFNETSISLLLFAVSELAGNMVKHAGGGEAEAEVLPLGKGLRVSFNDVGPGIIDIEKAMTDGYSSKADSLGIGLGGAKRAVDSFKIWSKPESGTRIVIEKWFPVKNNKFHYAVFSRPDALYSVNGDKFLFKQLSNEDQIFAVIDGLGEGYKANKIAVDAQEYILAHANETLSSIIEGLSKRIQLLFKGRGLSIALCKIEGSVLSFIGIGDCEVFINREGRNSQLPGNKGILGLYEKAKAKITQVVLEDRDQIVLFSDGISSGIYTDEISTHSGLQHSTNRLFNKYRRKTGDATLMLVKRIENYEEKV